MFEKRMPEKMNTAKQNIVKRNTVKQNIAKPIAFILIFGLLFTLLTGCEKTEDSEHIVLTMGFNKNEVFKLEDKVCTLPEVYVYLANTQNQYQNVYGDQLWDVSLDGVTMVDSVKDNVLAHVSQIKAMNIRAEQLGITLSHEEEQRVREAATEYFDSLNDTEKNLLLVTPEIIEKMYYEYALAYKFYEEVIKDINPEISDDEARTITVLQILIKTYTTDGSGAMVPFSDAARVNARKEAEKIHALAIDGEHDFQELIDEYSEGEKGVYSFGKGSMDKAFEDAAFNLGKDEISPVVESKYGYHIIKCINTFNREETDSNKLKIATKDRQEVFGKQYDEFADTLTTYLNEELWNEVQLFSDDNIKTQNFFEIYHNYFEED